MNLKKIAPIAIPLIALLFISGIIPLNAQSRISYEELSEMVENGDDYLLLDVRTRGEYENGHIPTSSLIPYDVLPSGMEDVKKDQLIVVYCRSGNRSGIAAKTLAKAGFTNVKDFGGISGWKGQLE